MNKKPIHLHYSYLIPAIIAICLIIVAFSSVIIYTDSEKTSNIIQNAISLATLIITGITLVFLYQTLIQQQKQIDDNKSDVEFNRVLDFIYKHIENSKNALLVLGKQREESNHPNHIYWNIENFLQHFIQIRENKLPYNKLGALLSKQENLIKSYICYKGRLNGYIDEFTKINTLYINLISSNTILNTHQKKLLGLIIQDLFYREEIHHIRRYKHFLIFHLNELESEVNYIEIESLKISVQEIITKIEVLEGYFSGN